MYSPDPNRAHRYVDLVEYAKRGMIDRIRHVIQCGGCNVNERDHDGECAVLFAAQRGDLEMLRVLVDAGARLDVKGRNGVTPLGWATSLGRSDMIAYVKSKLEQGAEKK